MFYCFGVILISLAPFLTVSKSGDVSVKMLKSTNTTGHLIMVSQAGDILLMFCMSSLL
jgi:hypothetical protein